MDVEIKEMPAMRVATVRHVGPYQQIPDAFARLDALVRPARLIGPRPTLLALYHDDPQATPESELRSDAGLKVSPDATIPAGLAETRVPAGRYATTTHVGPYEQLGRVWSRLKREWLPESGQHMKAAASFEIYRNTPAEVPAEQLRTELFLPLE